MSMRANRARAAARTAAMGGGVTEPSVTDTATDGDIMEHESGGPANELGAVELDWDESYGPFGTRSDLPHADPYTVEEARQDAASFAEPYLPYANSVRNVAQEGRYGTLTLQPGAPAYEIAGADPLRKRIIITNVSGGAADIALQTADVFIGARDVQAQGGSGALLLRNKLINAAASAYLPNDPALVVEHVDEVWVIPAVYAGVVHVPVTVTYMIERYTK